MNKEQSTNITKKKNRKVLIIGLIVIVVIVTLASGFIYVSGSKDRKLKETLQLADNYLNELEYEKAIATYEEAIKIDPKSADAYCGLADTYVAMADNAVKEGNIDKANEYYDAAIKALDEGINCVSDSDKERLETYKTIIESLKNKVAGEIETTVNSVQEESVDNNLEEIDYEIPEEILNINLFGKDWKTYTFDSLKAEMTKGLELRIDSEGIEKYMDGNKVVVSEHDNHDGYYLFTSPYAIDLSKWDGGFQVYIMYNDSPNDYNFGKFENYMGKNIFDILKGENEAFAKYIKQNSSEDVSINLNDYQGFELRHNDEDGTKIYEFGSRYEDSIFRVSYYTKESVIYQICLNYYF